MQLTPDPGSSLRPDSAAKLVVTAPADDLGLTEYLEALSRGGGLEDGLLLLC